MRSLFVKVPLIAMLAATTNLATLAAQDREAASPVPARADANNPDSDVYRASDVINLPVKDDEGAEVGRIKDLVINGTSREVLYAVVAMNDAKQKDAVYVMPWSVFQPSYGQMNAIQYTVLTVPQTVWVQAPFYTTAQWRQTPFSQWGPRVNNYYSEHITAGRTGRAGSTAVRVNKPNLNDDSPKTPNSPKSGAGKNNEKSTDPNESDKPAAKPKSNPATEASKSEATKPEASKPEPNLPPATKPKTNPNPAPEATKPKNNPAPDVTKPNTPGEKNIEAPKSNAPKLPAPKDTDPADPKVSASPAPREPKSPAPLPK